MTEYLLLYSYLCKMFSCRWSISLWKAASVHNPSPGHQRKGSFKRVGCKDELQEPFHRPPSWFPTFDSWQRLWRGLPPRVIRSKSSKWSQRKWSHSFLNKLFEHSFFPKDQLDTKQVYWSRLSWRAFIAGWSLVLTSQRSSAPHPYSF